MSKPSKTGIKTVKVEATSGEQLDELSKAVRKYRPLAVSARARIVKVIESPTDFDVYSELKDMLARKRLKITHED